MTEVSIYHLTTTTLEKVLPKLLEKVMELGKRCLLLASSEDRVESLNTVLWTYSTKKFLPHGSKKDGFAEHQPIWLSCDFENRNNASILVLTDNSAVESLDGFERCLDIFDDAGQGAEMLAQKRIQSYITAGHNVTYWLQDTTGSWQRKD